MVQLGLVGPEHFGGGDPRRLSPNDPNAGKDTTASVLQLCLYGRVVDQIFAEEDCAGHVL